MSNSNMAVMNKIVEYVRDRGDCSLGEIEIELNIKIWKQYEIHRVYKEYVKDVRIVRGRWKIVNAKEPTSMSSLKQGSLSHSLSKKPLVVRNNENGESISAV